MTSPTRRRLDRVTADDFLSDIAAASAADLRVMRDECREEEERLSYLRRVLLGQLDLLEAELRARGDGATETVAKIDGIAKLFGDAEQADHPAPMSMAHREMYMATGPTGRRRGDTVLEETPLGNLAEMDIESIDALVNRVSSEAEWVTQTRRIVLDHLDRLQAELVDRYRNGSTSVADIVTSA